MPPVAILEATPPDAKIMNNEFPSNFCFLKLFKSDFPKILRIGAQNAKIEFPQTFLQESPLETI